jgi:hypothetical protein
MHHDPLPAVLILLLLAPAGGAQEPWREVGVKQDGSIWRAVATEVGDDAAAAKQAAERAARRMLAEFSRSRIQSELLDVLRQRKRDGKAVEESDFQAVVRQTTDVELRGARTVRMATRRADGRDLGYAEVEIAEGDLFPATRLRAAMAIDGVEGLLTAADEFEVDRLWVLAEQALQVARDRRGGPGIEMRLGQHWEKRGDFEEALRWFTVVAGRERDGEAAKVARERIAAIQARVPGVEAIVRDLRQLADARRDPGRLRVSVQRQPGKVRVGIELREAGRRVLTTWIDDEVVLHWVATVDGSAIEGSFDLPLVWPRDDQPPPRRPARLVVWSLAADDPLWSELNAEKDKVWALDGDVEIAARRRLRELCERLRASSAQAWVVEMDA